MRGMMFAVVCMPLLALASDIEATLCDSSIKRDVLLQCALDQLDVVDRQLNEEYEALLRLAKGSPALTRNLRQAQHVWLMFRDAEVASQFSCDERNEEVCFGREYPIGVAAVKKRITQDRVTQLRAQRKELEDR